MQIEIKKYIDEDAKNFWKTQEKAQNLNLFQTYLWNSKVLKYFFQHNSDDLRIFTVKEKNEIIAIFPLYIKKKFIFNILSLIGDDFTDYNSPIFKKEIINNNDKINKIFNEIKLLDGKFDLICFKNQIDDIMFCKIIFNY